MRRTPRSSAVLLVRGAHDHARRLRWWRHVRHRRVRRRRRSPAARLGAGGRRAGRHNRQDQADGGLPGRGDDARSTRAAGSRATRSPSCARPRSSVRISSSCGRPATRRKRPFCRRRPRDQGVGRGAGARVRRRAGDRRARRGRRRPTSPRSSRPARRLRRSQQRELRSLIGDLVHPQRGVREPHRRDHRIIDGFDKTMATLADGARRHRHAARRTSPTPARCWPTTASATVTRSTS